jgi:ASC-1-like (ASCH) protein
MTFYSQISREAFDKIKSGRRIIEPRLNDDVHKQVRPGDLLVLTDRETKKELVAKVVGVLRYPSFVEMFHNNHVSRFGTNDELELLTEMHHYYSTAQEIKNGVLGLKLHVLKSGKLE